MPGVVSRISFGLGNQMYQFAAGYTIARRLGCAFDLDVSWYQKPPQNTAPRQLLLTEFVFPPHFRKLRDYKPVDHLIDRLFRSTDLFRFKPHRYRVPIWVAGGGDSSFDSINSPVFVEGVPVKPALESHLLNEVIEIYRTGLKSALEINPPFESFAFVHVRLGDYVSNESVQSKVVNLNKEHYRKAMSRYEALNGPTNWILISDDVESASSIIPGEYAVQSIGCSSELEDLQLMMMSEGGVIANSAFSLWGGLISKGGNSNVIAPKYWRKDQTRTPSMPIQWTLL